MKTITEYQPLMFSHLAAAAEKRLFRQRQLRADIPWAAGYIAWGLWLTIDTGFMAWEWQFWMMFAPVVLGVEVASRALSKYRMTLDRTGE